MQQNNIIEVSGSKQKEWYKILAQKAPEIINAMRNTIASKINVITIFLNSQVVPC